MAQHSLVLSATEACEARREIENLRLKMKTKMGGGPRTQMKLTAERYRLEPQSVSKVTKGMRKYLKEKYPSEIDMLFPGIQLESCSEQRKSIESKEPLSNQSSCNKLTVALPKKPTIALPNTKAKLHTPGAVSDKVQTRAEGWRLEWKRACWRWKKCHFPGQQTILYLGREHYTEFPEFAKVAVHSLASKRNGTIEERQAFFEDSYRQLLARSEREFEELRAQGQQTDEPMCEKHCLMRSRAVDPQTRRALKVSLRRNGLLNSSGNEREHFEKTTASVKAAHAGARISSVDSGNVAQAATAKMQGQLASPSPFKYFADEATMYLERLNLKYSEEQREALEGE